MRFAVNFEKKENNSEKPPWWKIQPSWCWTLYAIIWIRLACFQGLLLAKSFRNNWQYCQSRLLLNFSWTKLLCFWLRNGGRNFRGGMMKRNPPLSNDLMTLHPGSTLLRPGGHFNFTLPLILIHSLPLQKHFFKITSNNDREHEKDYPFGKLRNKTRQVYEHSLMMFELQHRGFSNRNFYSWESVLMLN